MVRGIPLVSILVHTKNSQRTIKNLLDSIKQQSYKQIEIIVVDNNSTDDTVNIAKAYTKKIFIYGPERSAQRNFAAKKSSGEYLFVPDSDMIIGKDVITQCVSLVKEKNEIKAVIIPEKSIGIGFWATCKALERSYYVGLPWMEGARFFDRHVFEEIRGYDENNTGTEDFDLPQRIQEKYGISSIGRIEEFILHDEGQLSLSYLLKKKFYYSKNLGVYKQKNPTHFTQQANLLSRYALFFSKPQKLFKSPIVGMGMLFMKTCEFGAGGLGYLLKKMKGYSVV